MSWKKRLDAAIKAEVSADDAAAEAEIKRRATWWETTWALADVPRAEWGEAAERYVKKTGHSRKHATARRSCGQRLAESLFEETFPLPRFAMQAAAELGKNPSDEAVAEMIETLAQAERDGESVREFSARITGRSWTSTPENLTPTEKVDIARSALDDPALSDDVLGGDDTADKDRRHKVDSKLRDRRRAETQRQIEEWKKDGNHLPVDPDDPELHELNQIVADALEALERRKKEPFGSATAAFEILSELSDAISSAKASWELLHPELRSDPDVGEIMRDGIFDQIVRLSSFADDVSGDLPVANPDAERR